MYVIIRAKEGLVAHKQDLGERFLRQIDIIPWSGCWIWLGNTIWSGYGQISVNDKPQSTHRFAYAFFKGTIPAGMCVLHSCDIPSCVNPNHLRLGTLSENTEDCVNKGRHTKARRSLSLEQVQEILSTRGSYRKVAKQFNTCINVIWNIRHQNTYKEITLGN